jgi:hypothetical protein
MYFSNEITPRMITTTRDLRGAAIERQQVDQIKNKNNDEKRYQRAHKHSKSPLNIAKRQSRVNPQATARFHARNWRRL